MDLFTYLSEMSWTKKINKAEDVLNLGDEVIARIISIKKDKRQISLTLKSIESDPWYRLKGRYPLNTEHEGVVERPQAFGAIINLEEGVSGLFLLRI